MTQENKEHEEYVDEILRMSRHDADISEDRKEEDVYDLYCVPLELYHQYRDTVLRLSLAYQRWVANADGGILLMPLHQLTDKQIAGRLGLEEDTVRRIRCMAEFDFPMELWRNAAAFKYRAHKTKPLGISSRSIKTEPW